MSYRAQQCVHRLRTQSVTHTHTDTLSRSERANRRIFLLSLTIVPARHRSQGKSDRDSRATRRAFQTVFSLASSLSPSSPIDFPNTTLACSHRFSTSAPVLPVARTTLVPVLPLIFLDLLLTFILIFLVRAKFPLSLQPRPFLCTLSHLIHLLSFS